MDATCRQQHSTVQTRQVDSTDSGQAVITRLLSSEGTQDEQRYGKNLRTGPYNRGFAKNSSGAVHSSAWFFPAGLFREGNAKWVKADDGDWGRGRELEERLASIQVRVCLVSQGER